jgi:hypothetical protein
MMEDKIYIGDNLTKKVIVHLNNKLSVYDLRATNHLMNHSPGGFYWGYNGSGPAQLALSILQDHFNNDEKALKYYQDFKNDIIAKLDKKRVFTLTSNQINEWFRKHDVAKGR